jgi:hypothetical protein
MVKFTFYILQTEEETLVDEGNDIPTPMKTDPAWGGLYNNSPTYGNSTLRKYLPTGADLKKSWKSIFHPAGNK